MTTDHHHPPPVGAADVDPSDVRSSDHDTGAGQGPSTSGRSGHRWAAGHTIVAVILALVLGAVFNAADLLATAERQEFGLTRDVSVATAQALVTVSETLRLDRPRAAIDQALGRSDPAVGPDAPALTDDVEMDDAPEPGDETLAIPELAEGRDPSDPPVPGDREVDDTPSDGGDDDAGTGSVREITREDPLTIYIGGDSMVGQFGMALEDLTDDTGMVTATEVRYEFSSGLSRPDFIDWPAVMEAVSAEQDPEVVVMYFGGNDAQALEIDGTVYEPEDEPWQQEYRTRVRDLMTQLQDAGHAVYWMGMPIPRSETLQARYLMLNEIYGSEAEAHEAVTFIPAWDVFAGPDGGFSEFLPNASGDLVDMRLDDGIHYTTAGAYRIARVAADRIIADYDIPPAD